MIGQCSKGRCDKHRFLMGAALIIRRPGNRSRCNKYHTERMLSVSHCRMVSCRNVRLGDVTTCYIYSDKSLIELCHYFWHSQEADGTAIAADSCMPGMSVDQKKFSNFADRQFRHT